MKVDTKRPPPAPVRWKGRVKRTSTVRSNDEATATAQLWYEARAEIATKLGVSIFDVELEPVEAAA